MKSNLEAFSSQDLVCNTGLYGNKRFYSSLALELAKVVYNTFTIDGNSEVTVYIMYAGAHVTLEGMNMRFLPEKKTKLIVLAEIDKLSKLERVMYGIEP